MLKSITKTPFYFKKFESLILTISQFFENTKNNVSLSPLIFNPLKNDSFRRVLGLEFGVLGLGFGVWVLGFGVWVLGFEIWDLGSGNWDFGVRVSG